MAIAGSLRLRLSLLFLAFLALVTASVAVTFVTLERQRHDARLINLAGRQRMLSQRMTWLALAAPDSAALQADRARFQQTLNALRFGGSALDPEGQPVVLPAPTDPALENAMAAAAAAWERFQAALDRLSGPARRAAPAAEDVTALTTASAALLDSLDRSVAVLAALAEAKVQRLRLIQASFLLMALALLVVGYCLTRSHLLRPLARLERSAQQMAVGNLEVPVPTVFVLHELRHADGREPVVVGHRWRHDAGEDARPVGQVPHALRPLELD
ncbi:MAG: type IV pili methyl-accepting chemotaxis transducer N-terminal domain-containing protein, partial [Caldilineales bacterium]|nr:type IV pili methyl-accepting chemotaxis transducer N-terminal domain-containing protein [Caldilineales bacterium]